MRFWPALFLAAGIYCAAASCCAQAPRPAAGEAPKIDKIDPPGWWSGLPDPMLLVHGENLKQARFTLDGKNASLIRSQVSANGHWAFLWLRTKDAPPQTLWVTARTDRGQARSAFQLAARAAGPNAHSGFSSADALYLIMPDRFAKGNPGNGRRERIEPIHTAGMAEILPASRSTWTT